MSLQVRPALQRFKIMAVIVGIGLLILCLEIVLHYGFDNEALAWWSPVHGLLYMGYLVATVDLGLKARWPLLKMVGVMVAGAVPFFSFVAERKVAAEFERQPGSTGADRLRA